MSPRKWITGILILLGVALSFFSLTKQAGGFMSQIIEPVQSAFFQASLRLGVQNIGRERTASREIKKENKTLKDHVNNLVIENIRLREQIEESKKIIEQQGFLSDRKLPHLQSRVFGRSSDQLTATLLIDRGKQDGVSEGMAVIVDQGIFIGTIFSSSQSSSKVKLVTNTGMKFASLIFHDEKEIQGIIEGRHGLSLKLNFVPQTETIRPNDIVVTEPALPFIPKNLPIGTIASITTSKSDLWQSATVTPLFHPEDISIVSVILLDEENPMQ